VLREHVRDALSHLPRAQNADRVCHVARLL
jgi:hypothetical protein